MIGKDEWLEHSSLTSNSGRIDLHDQLDQEITEWTQRREAKDVMNELQKAGIPSGAVQKSSDLLTDPQYAHRDFYRYMKHPEMGTIPYAGHQYQMSSYKSGPRAPAPTLGQHSFDILGDLLGMSDEAIAESYAKEIVG